MICDEQWPLHWMRDEIMCYDCLKTFEKVFNDDDIQFKIFEGEKNIKISEQQSSYIHNKIRKFKHMLAIINHRNQPTTTTSQ